MNRVVADTGVFIFGDDSADALFNQCDGPMGEHRHLRLRPRDRAAPHWLVLPPPINGRGRPKPRNGPARWLARRRGTWDALWAEHAWRALLDGTGRTRDDVTALVYEPSEAFSDAWWAVTRRYAARVFGPDARATHPVRLPAVWTLDDPLAALRAEAPPHADRKPITLACVTSGTTHLPGHRARLGFIERVRRAGVPMHLFGRGLPAALQGLGPVRSKASALRPALLSLVIENSAAGEHYVTEKLWDALLCWSLPIYHGSAAADAMIPPEAFIRLPDIAGPGPHAGPHADPDAGPDAALEVVRHATAHAATLWASRLDAIAEARRRILHELRLVEWAAGVIAPA